MRSFISKIKNFYEKGIYSDSDVLRLLNSGKITSDEYNFIIEIESEETT